MTRNLIIEQVIPEYRSWLRKVAAGMLSPDHEALDDLVQEGYIAMWRACASYDEDGSPADFWLKSHAHMRMMTCVSRNHWTGQPKRHNGGHGGSQPDKPVLSFDVLNAAVDADYDPADVSAAVALEQAVWGYHQGELLQALSALTEREREYVVRRFWGEAQQAELDRFFGCHSPNIWRTARPKLARALERLVLT